MAGLDQEFDGIARPLPGASIGYLSQEPVLPFETVAENIQDAVQSSQAILDKYNELSMKLADPALSADEMSRIMEQTEQINSEIEAKNLWELDRVVSRAMESLRVPPGDARVSVLSGGEKRRVALCRLLLGNHDMLLLDGTLRAFALAQDPPFTHIMFVSLEPTNHLDTDSVYFLEVGSLEHQWQAAGSVVRLSCYFLHFFSNILHNTKEPWYALRTIDTFWKTLQSGFWNLIEVLEFHTREITVPG
jgi:energy-dependent translational throttle protein EttA